MTHQLINRAPAQKSAAPSRHAQDIERRRKAVKAFDAEFAALARNKVSTEGPRHLLAGLYPSIAPTPVVAQKATPVAAAPDSVRRIAHRTSSEGVAFLSALVRRYEETKGQAISFSTDDAAAVMGCTREAADRVLGSLTQQGLTTPRTNNAGGLAGYVPSFPA